MAELAEADKQRIVELLAGYRTPAEVVKIMLAEYGVEVTHDQVIRYNPQHASFRADRDKWEPIFNAAREAYITDLKKVVAANQAWRLNQLTKLYETARDAKNIKLAADLLEQIARECGGALTNTRELNVTDGRKAKDMTAEDRRALLGSIIAEELARRNAEAQQEQPTKH